MSHLLEVKNLDVKFDTDEGRITAVENISLSLDQGKVLGSQDLVNQSLLKLLCS